MCLSDSRNAQPDTSRRRPPASKVNRIWPNTPKVAVALLKKATPALMRLRARSAHPHHAVVAVPGGLVVVAVQVDAVVAAVALRLLADLLSIHPSNNS